MLSFMSSCGFGIWVLMRWICASQWRETTRVRYSHTTRTSLLVTYKPNKEWNCSTKQHLGKVNMKLLENDSLLKMIVSSIQNSLNEKNQIWNILIPNVSLNEKFWLNVISIIVCKLLKWIIFLSYTFIVFI